MFPLAKLLGSAVASAVAFATWKLSVLLYRRLTSPLRRLRGPVPPSLLWGNVAELDKEPEDFADIWAKEHGSTLSFKGFFLSNLLLTLDTRAVNHILTHSNDFQKPYPSRYLLSRVFGEGLLVTEGAQHRQQRRIMNPAFGPVQIRELTDIFVAKAARLRDILVSETAKNPFAASQIDIVPWLNKLTLEVIGLAGFGYNFEALDPDGKPNELNEAFSTMFSAMFLESENLGLFPILQVWFPILRLIPTDSTRKISAARRTMAQIGQQLLTDAKTAARASATEKGEIEKNSLQGKDLLSLLVKANLATDIPESQRLSDADVLAQVPTFLVAGHETTSTAVMWALYAMTQAPEIQTKLRDELLSLDTETPSMDDLTALPYLDAVVRETLRVHAPVSSTSRIAMKDELLPVEKPFTDRYGVMHDSIKITKGDAIMIPILAMNQSEALWGPDAKEFKPERWENVPESISQIPGVWGHLLTFIGGPRACIGYRFSLIEMKAILFFLIRAFEFELAVPASEIGRKTVIVQQPILRDDPTKTVQLPLLVKPYQRS